MYNLNQLYRLVVEGSLPILQALMLLQGPQFDIPKSTRPGSTADNGLRITVVYQSLVRPEHSSGGGIAVHAS